MPRRLLPLVCLLGACASPPSTLAVVPKAGLEAILTIWDREEPADLRGVVVLQRGHAVAERYYGGATPTDLHDVRSAGKSVTGLLMAMSIERGLVSGMNAPVSDYWPEASGAPVGEATIADLLSMRSGLAAYDEDPSSAGNEDRLDEAVDPLAFILSVPADGQAGRQYRYNSLTSSVAGIVIAKASGRSMGDFARDTLFAPLGVSEWRWEADRAGYTKGQGNLWLRLRDFAAVGELVRCRGAYRGRQLVNASLLEALLTPRVQISDEDPYADAYGGFWYSKTYEVGGESVPVVFASGNGGNKIYVVPDRGLVVAIQSAAYGRGYGQRRSQAILLSVLAATARSSDPTAGCGPIDISNTRNSPWA